MSAAICGSFDTPFDASCELGTAFWRPKGISTIAARHPLDVIEPNARRARTLRLTRTEAGFVRTRIPLLASSAGVVSCLILGGATNTGHLSDAILQYLSIPLVLASVWCIDATAAKQLRVPLRLCLATALLPLLQLVPLPPQVWTALPGREPLVATFGLLEQDLPWMPISVSPQATWLSLLSLLPAAAVFVGTLQLGYRQRRVLSLVAIAAGMPGVIAGLVQVVQGESSPLRFFEITNASEAVGFFANRNHFAALLYILLLLVAAWLVRTAEFAPGQGRRDTPRMLLLAANILLLIALVAAQAIARSRAGIALTIVAFLAAVALAFSERGNTPGRTPTHYIVGVLVFAVLLAIQYALYRILDRFSVEPLADSRIAFSATTILAAKAFFPFGSGMGTFVPVYAMFEKPDTALMDAFANRAHNDFLELWLETGIPGALLAAAFLVWFAGRAMKIWTGSLPGTDGIDRLLARAAVVAVVLIIAHSLVDYPLRTGAVLAMIALAFGLMSNPPAGIGEEEAEGHDQTKVEPVAPPARVSVPERESWGADMNWPDAWRRRGGKAPRSD